MKVTPVVYVVMAERHRVPNLKLAKSVINEKALANTPGDNYKKICSNVHLRGCRLAQFLSA
jgi:hypothetical protein